MPKRLDDVAPPPGPGEWRIRFATTDAATDWPEMCAQFPGNAHEAWNRMRHSPMERTGTQKPLAGPLATRQVRGEELAQWQIDISSGARLIYAVDPAERTVWVMMAATGHPGATVAKGKRSSRNR